MLFSDQPLRPDREIVAEQRLRKSLSPDLRFEQPRGFEAHVSGRQGPVGLDGLRELGGAEQLARDALESFGEALEIRRFDGDAGRCGVSAESKQHAGLAPVEQIERIAQVQARYRASRTADLPSGLALYRRRKCKHRTVVAIFEATRDDADHALVP